MFCIISAPYEAYKSLPPWETTGFTLLAHFIIVTIQPEICKKPHFKAYEGY
jgi:hypothetical protein